ncbi:MAG: hypothetical protein WA123_10995 [Methylotenera sp.]
MNLHHTILFIGMLAANSGAIAAPVGDCTGTPADAVVELPAPLSSWGQIACTQYGHIITNNTGYIWSYPGAYAPVFVPSQMVRNNPTELGNKSYFTSIKMTKVEGTEFEEPYSAFHSGFAKDKSLPSGYRLDATSVSGDSLKLYFFDYGDSAWGIWCRETCDPTSSFMVLNMAKQPNNAVKRDALDARPLP